ncbi:MAG: hypothetical protein JXD19_12990 [Deltaproteobacteria bacterium]|nr:hypothetical protein [Deltaproteobacteria bacterium]
MNSFLANMIKVSVGFAVTLAVGCGVKALPVVPYSPIPRPINDLTVFSRMGAIVLQWSVPAQDAEGKKLSALGGFHVWRFLPPVDEGDCPGCPERFHCIADIDYRFPQNARISQGKVTVWDDDVTKEGKYRYRITSYTTAGIESKASNVDEITWSSPFPPPVNVAAIPDDRSVTLKWGPPVDLAQTERDTVSKGFTVYRRYYDQEYGLVPLNEIPIQEGEFYDVSVANGERYSYVIRTLKATNGKMIESKNSTEITVVPEDRTPPAPPRAHVVLQSPNGIEIMWEPNVEPDLLGYFVYRRSENEATPRRVSPLLQGTTTFLDTIKNSAGGTFYYSVTAVDSSPHRNESDYSQELSLTVEGPDED